MRGRPFLLLLFRTMAHAAPDATPDERLTAVGRFLRTYSLDHLPMLVDVLRGELSLGVPAAGVRAKTQPYMRNGKPVHRPERLHDSVYSIVEQYQLEYRGIVEYYRIAHHLTEFDTVRWVMETSLLKTLASKPRINVAQAAWRFRTVVPIDQGPHEVLRVVVERGPDEAPLVAQWGGVSLEWRVDAAINDQPPRVWKVGTDLLQRLLGDECELCGSHQGVQVHHVQALKDLQPQRSGPKPEWVRVMTARHRKALVVCARCHEDIHVGRLPRQQVVD